MATIRASCPDCGDVELTTADMTVRVCSEDQRGTYAFRCPACTMAVTKSKKTNAERPKLSTDANRVSTRTE